MLFTLGKLLQEPTHPLTLVLLFLAVSLYFLKRQRPAVAQKLIWGAFWVLFLSSLPIISMLIVYPLESRFPPMRTESYPKADAIVVLGGSVSKTLGPRLEPEEQSGTRLLMAMKLYKAGKAPIIIVSGGGPYATETGIRRESLDMKEILISMGVPANAILEETKSRNTKENALYTKELFSPFDPLQAKRILLVTTAPHLPRATLWFSRMHYEVTPVPSEHYACFEGYDLNTFLPNAKALLGTTLVLKEYLGLVVAYVGS